MKHIQRTLVLMLAATMALGAAAAPKKKSSSSNGKYSQDLHYLSMWGGAGYSGLVNNFKGGTYTDLLGNTNTFSPKFIGGGGGMLGFGYEFHKKLSNGNWFLLGVGPEFRCFSSQDNFNYTLGEGVLHQYSAQQPDYTTMRQHYDFSRFHETNVIGQVMLPLYVGGQFAQDRFYVLAGGKVGWGVFDSWRQRGRLTSSVTEQMAMDDWYDIPTHDLISNTQLLDHPLYQSSSKGKNKFGMFGGLDASVYAEFGVNLNEFFPDQWQTDNEGKKHPWLMRVGAFIDYGLPNLNTQTNGFASASGEPLVNATGTSVATNSLYQTHWAAEGRVNSLIVGVKFTALLQLNKPKQPNPRMNILVVDSLSKRPIAMSPISIQPENVVNFSGKGKAPKARPLKKVKKDGSLTLRLAKGKYYLSVPESPRYLSSDTIIKDLQQDNKFDTVRLSQIPRPLLVSYIHDASTEQIIGGAIEYTNNRNGDLITMSSRADKNNGVEISLHYGDTYSLHITAPNYHDTTAVVTSLYDTTQYYLRPIRRVRRTLILKRMYFATDKTNILQASEPDLMVLYNFLVENPKVRVLITGHTDSQGSDAYNQKLSEGRSASVKDEMVKRGINPDRMETDGKGETEPIDTNDTEEGRQNNRRVQITVLNAEDATEDVY